MTSVNAVPAAAPENIDTDWLKQWSQFTPQRICIKDASSQREFSYSETYSIAQRLASHLREFYQVQRGDRVAVLATNEIEHFFLFFALQRLGAILVPINFRLTAREVTHILSDSDSKLLIYQRAFDSLVEQIPSKSRPAQSWFFEGPDSLKEYIYKSWDSEANFANESLFDDPCMILYTSGTTGAPKGALITHKMLFWNAVTTGLRLDLSQKDICLAFLPFFHTSGWNVLNTPFFHRGAKVIFLPKFDADAVLNLTETERVTIMFGVPTMLEMMRQSPRFLNVNLQSVRYAVVGGEPMPIPLIRIWAEKGIPIRQGFGMTEFGPNLFSLNEQDAIRKIGSIGFPNTYVDTRIVDNDGNDVHDGDVGELWLRGPACTPGYWRNEKETKGAIQDGWFASGDLVRRDEEGYFYVIGRKKDMYISGGENVYPTEVEQVLRAHPHVQEATVVGVPDEKWGEVGRAFIVLKAECEIKSEDIYNHCLAQLAKFKIPRHITFLNELPKGDSGKILKKALRDLEL